jgi:hypothetical protein
MSMSKEAYQISNEGWQPVRWDLGRLLHDGIFSKHVVKSKCYAYKSYICFDPK